MNLHGLLKHLLGLRSDGLIRFRITSFPFVVLALKVRAGITPNDERQETADDGEAGAKLQTLKCGECGRDHFFFMALFFLA